MSNFLNGAKGSRSKSRKLSSLCPGYCWRCNLTRAKYTAHDVFARIHHFTRAFLLMLSCNLKMTLMETPCTMGDITCNVDIQSLGLKSSRLALKKLSQATYLLSKRKYAVRMFASHQTRDDNSQFGLECL